MAPSPSIRRRPAGPQDRPFLLAVYSSTRQEELAPVPWTDQQKAEFLRQQFEAQDAYYREHYADGEFSVLLQGDVAVGRLYLHRHADELRIVDIALLPDYRGQGIGSGVLKEILEEARQLQVPVRIYVERENPAMRLYDRLGFRKSGETGVYDLLYWFPAEN